MMQFCTEYEPEVAQAVSNRSVANSNIFFISNVNLM